MTPFEVTLTLQLDAMQDRQTHLHRRLQRAEAALRRGLEVIPGTSTLGRAMANIAAATWRDVAKQVASDLAKYGRHLPGCPSVAPPPIPLPTCTCGFAEAKGYAEGSST